MATSYLDTRELLITAPTYVDMDSGIISSDVQVDPDNINPSSQYTDIIEDSQSVDKDDDHIPQQELYVYIEVFAK